MYMHHSIEKINESHCCYVISLERGLMFLWIFHILEGIVDIVVASVSTVSSDSTTRAIVMTIVVLGAIVSFITAYYGVVGTSRRDIKKVNIAYQLFIISTFVELLSYLIRFDILSILLVVIIDGYLIYEIRQYLNILQSGQESTNDTDIPAVSDIQLESESPAQVR